MANFEFIYVGAGSSVAYYLDSLLQGIEVAKSLKDVTSVSEKEKLLKSTMLIGTRDNWDVSVRGPGWINQWMQLLGHWSDGVPIYNEDFADREEFSKTNKDIIDKAQGLGMKVLPHWVSRISSEKLDHDEDGRKAGEKWYKIESQADTESATNYARKVIVGMGAGPHANRTKVEQVAQPRAMNIDDFMVKMKTAAKPGETVVIQGAFAAVDGAKLAKKLGFNIIWLIRDTKPNFLAGRGDAFVDIEEIAKTKPNLDLITNDPAENAAILKDQLISGVNSVEVILDKTGSKILLTCKTEAKTFALTADYYCYALGQDAFAPRALGKVLSDEIRASLRPIYDIDQYYTDRPFETVLGLKVEGTTSTEGLEIVGAGANALHSNQAGTKNAQPVLHDYLKIWEVEYDQAKKLLLIQIDSLATGKVIAEQSIASLLKYVKEIDETKIDGLDQADTIRWLDDKDKLEGLLDKVTQENGDAGPMLRRHFSAFLNAWKQSRQAAYYFENVKPGLIQDKKKTPGSKVSENVYALDIEFENQTRFMSLAFLNADQLGPVKNSIAARTAVMPDYVIPRMSADKCYVLERGKVNFSMDSRTVLATYIAWNYPNISSKDREAFIAKVVGARRIQKNQEQNVKGFDDNQVSQLLAALDSMEQQKAVVLEKLPFLNVV